MTALLTIPEAAVELRCHPETVRRAIRSGRLTASLFGGKYLIRPEDLPAALPPREPTRHRQARPGRFSQIARDMDAA